MVTITEIEGCIVITGHAEYAPRGQDIVCSAISTLTATLIESVNELTDNKIYHVKNDENVVIRCTDHSEAVKLLKRSFFIGVEMVANTYPEHVKLV